MARFLTTKQFWLPMVLLASCILVSACGSQEHSGGDPMEGESKGFLSELSDLSPPFLSEGEKLRVVATTSVVGDVVANIGGEAIELITLMAANVDPHAYEPTPADLRAVSDAHVVFINGLDLEEFLDEMIENVAGDVPVVSLSAGLDALSFEGEFPHGEQPSAEENGDHEHGVYDPHVWFDPTNVMIWTDRIARALVLLDPQHESLYENNAASFHEQLQELDQWIFVNVSLIPVEKRKLVSDHRVFEYFAARYDFEIVGAVIPVFSSAAEPSAREVADLQERILEMNVKVLFVGEAIHQSIVEAIIQDTGTRLVYLYTGALSDPDGPAGNYLDYMRYNVESIVSALQE
jgi:ABC-type Zn uptake system ZnuABC Zn-binding protein ZnuA